MLKQIHLKRELYLVLTTRPSQGTMASKGKRLIPQRDDVRANKLLKKRQGSHTGRRRYETSLSGVDSTADDYYSLKLVEMIAEEQYT